MMERCKTIGMMGFSVVLVAALGSACGSSGGSGGQGDALLAGGSDGVPVPQSGVRGDSQAPAIATMTPMTAVPTAPSTAPSMDVESNTATPSAGTGDAGSPTMSGASSSGAVSAGEDGQAPGEATAMAGLPAAGANAEGAPAGMGGFPRGDEMDVNQMGPYSFESYTDGLDSPTYASSVMYYPTDAPPPFAAVVFSPGFTATKEQYMEFLGPLLASHGIAILLTTPTTTGDLPTQRSEDLQAAFAQIAAENERADSPLLGKLAPDRVCVTGHSMGGGGSLWAAAELGDRIRCAVPLQPWQPGQSFSSIVAPTMFIAAQNDSIAGVASNARAFYASIPETVEKYYVEFAGASHYLTSNSRGSHYELQSKYMLAFYKVFLEDDERYREILDAPADPMLSEYLH